MNVGVPEAPTMYSNEFLKTAKTDKSQSEYMDQNTLNSILKLSKSAYQNETVYDSSVPFTVRCCTSYQVHILRTDMLKGVVPICIDASGGSALPIEYHRIFFIY